MGKEISQESFSEEVGVWEGNLGNYAALWSPQYHWEDWTVPWVSLRFPFEAALILFGTWFCFNTIARRRGTEPYTTLGMALSITARVSSVYPILHHGIMAQVTILSPFTYLFTYLFYLLFIGLALTPHLVTFGLLEGEVRDGDLCHWRKGTSGHHFSSALPPLFSFTVFLKGGGNLWRPLRLCREGTRFFLIYHVCSHQLTFWIHFPIDPRVELQTVRIC